MAGGVNRFGLDGLEDAATAKQQRRLDRDLLRRLLRGQWTHLVGLSVLSFVSALLEALFLVLVTRAGLAVADGADEMELVAGRTASIAVAVGVSVVLVGARTVTGLIAGSWSARLTTDVSLSLRHQLGTAFLGASWAVQHEERPGRLQELIGAFVERVVSLVSSLVNGLKAALSLVAMLATALVVDLLASLAVVVALVVLGSLLAPLRRRVRRRSREAAGHGLEFSTAVSELGSLGVEMQVFGVRPSFQTRLDALSSAQAGAARRALALRAAVPVVYTSLAYLAIAGALAATATLGTVELASVGAVLVVMLRSLSYGQAAQVSAASVAAGAPNLSALYAAMDRYAAEQATSGSVSPATVRKLDLQQVSFAYPGADTPALRGLSLVIEPGEVLGVVGPSGSGKSTLVQLLLGLRNPTAGRIDVDGTDLRDIARDTWASLVAFVPQDAHLFSGTVAENIAFFRPEVDRAAIERAARAAQIFDEIAAMPQGFDTVVGERGGRLSGGQRQRLCIARALVAEPVLLVMDEPTSALDPRSESLFRDAVSSLRGRVTVVIVAHRLSTLSICDRIAVVQLGELLACDRPSVLESSEGFYKDALAHSELPG